jgi:nuclear pore complex protein Nup93
MANNTPIWARIFLLLRAGHPEEALNFATDNEQYLQKLERGFLSYFKAWLDSPDKRCVPRLSGCAACLTAHR